MDVLKSSFEELRLLMKIKVFCYQIPTPCDIIFNEKTF